MSVIHFIFHFSVSLKHLVLKQEHCDILQCRKCELLNVEKCYVQFYCF